MEVKDKYESHSHFVPTGICCSRPVPGTEERWGVVSGMVEGYKWSKHQTAGWLLQLSARVVRLLPVVHCSLFVLFSFFLLHTEYIYLTINLTFRTKVTWPKIVIALEGLYEVFTCSITAHFVYCSNIIHIHSLGLETFSSFWGSFVSSYTVLYQAVYTYMYMCIH